MLGVIIRVEELQEKNEPEPVCEVTNNNYTIKCSDATHPHLYNQSYVVQPYIIPNYDYS
jgi:hypothetical protein